jgi:hypothetical protein
VEEYELLTQLSQRFHQMTRQYFTGIPGEHISDMSQENKLGNWWMDFIHNQSETRELGFILKEGTLNYPDIVIFSSLGNYRIYANFNLISVTKDHRFFIVDWKTSQKKPSNLWLNNRIQTKIYPYLLADEAALSIGKTIDQKTLKLSIGLQTARNPSSYNKNYTRPINNIFRN